MLLKLLKERKKPFNVDYDLKEDVGNDDGDKSDGDLDSFDTVCAICHNGGGLIWYSLLTNYLSISSPCSLITIRIID